MQKNNEEIKTSYFQIPSLFSFYVSITLQRLEINVYHKKSNQSFIKVFTNIDHEIGFSREMFKRFSSKCNFISFLLHRTIQYFFYSSIN